MTDSDRIRELGARTVERIAAGEVVERPASVAKELVENSLDADASRIDVSVAGDGTEHLAISDDGVGMTEADVRAAVKKHTTSKIRGIDDLEAGVGTLGFRGEALHTIGAVSKLTITTRTREGDGDAATELRVEGGETVSVGPAGRAPGTTIEVADLFYNTPARRKYLKSGTTEFAHINTVVTQYALANPDVAVSLSHDGREVFATTGQADLQSTVLSVYGREVAAAMCPVEYEGDGPLDGVRGYVSDPETTRSSREYLSTYVNGRYVTAGAVRNAVLDAYGGQLAPDRYPFAVLFLDIDPGTVDVNVHPRKMEVRFGDEGSVTSQVEAAVETALLEAGLVRSSAPRGRSAPEETAISPERDRSEQAELDAGEASEPRESASREESEPGPERQTPERPSRTSRRTEVSRNAEAEPSSGTGSTPVERESGEERNERDERRDPSRGRGPVESSRKFAGPVEAGTLDGSDAFEGEFERLPALRVLGQLHDTYVVAETDDGMVLVDQHAADERVNYERLCAELADDATRQVLASPVELELTAREAAAFDDYAAALEQVGFDARRADDRTVVVETVPAVFDDALDPDLLRDVLAEFIEDERIEETAADVAADELLSDLACYPSVTGNTSLTEGSVVALLRALDACENPYACPHGRPVLIEFGGREIEDRFERDYPGHAGRRQE